MNGDLWIDMNYDSGVEGCPGPCFVVDLNTSPVDIESKLPLDDSATETPLISGSPCARECEKTALQPQLPKLVDPAASTGGASEVSSGMTDNSNPSLSITQPTSSQACPVTKDDSALELPNDISVWFVDDDAMLRKLLMQTVKKGCTIHLEIPRGL